jgi:hypothetical protein
LKQGWPTQIGPWAAFEKTAKICIDFLGHFATKTCKNKSKNIEKSVNLH